MQKLNCAYIHAGKINFTTLDVSLIDNGKYSFTVNGETKYIRKTDIWHFFDIGEDFYCVSWELSNEALLQTMMFCLADNLSDIVKHYTDAQKIIANTLAERK